MAFDAVDSEGVPVYHTNVIACVGTDVAMIALEMIPDEEGVFSMPSYVSFDARQRSVHRFAGAGMWPS